MGAQDSAILSKTQGDVTVVRFTANELKEDLYTEQASEELRKLALGVGGKVLLCLANVRYVSSSGVGALLLFHRLLSSVRGQLKICSVQPLIRRVFATAGVDQVFDIHATEAEALAAFKAGKRKR